LFLPTASFTHRQRNSALLSGRRAPAVLVAIQVPFPRTQPTQTFSRPTTRAAIQVPFPPHTAHPTFSRPATLELPFSKRDAFA
jgi:hypothetical protein